MKESKAIATTTIEKILEELTEEKQKEVSTLYNECMKAICCDEVEWKAFEVFLPSCDTMKIVLNAMAPEYLMAIADKINQDKNITRKVKITFIITKKETSIYTINQNTDVTLAYISLSEKRKKELEEMAEC